MEEEVEASYLERTAVSVLITARESVIVGERASFDALTCKLSTGTFL